MFESIKDAPQWTRAKADTKGFNEWGRNAIISLVPAAAIYTWRWFRAPSADALAVDWSDFLVAIVTFIVAFVLIPVVELSANYIRAPRRILDDENKQLRAGLLKLEGEVAALQRKLDDSGPRFYVKDHGIKDVGVDESVGEVGLHERINIAILLKIESGRRPAKELSGRFVFVHSGLTFHPWIAGVLEGGYGEQRHLAIHRPLPVTPPGVQCWMATEIVFKDPKTEAENRQAFYWRWSGVQPDGRFESIFTDLPKMETDRLVSYLNQHMPNGWRR